LYLQFGVTVTSAADWAGWLSFAHYNIAIFTYLNITKQFLCLQYCVVWNCGSNGADEWWLRHSLYSMALRDYIIVCSIVWLEFTLECCLQYIRIFNFSKLYSV